MKITAIQKQLKRQDQYSIFIDGKYNFSLSGNGLLQSHLAVGQEIELDELGELRKQVELDVFYSKSINYLSIRPRSTWEMQTYLKLKKCPSPLQLTILNKLSKLDLLDDLAFAKSWINNRRLLKPVSKRRLTYELATKHVPREIIEKAMAEDITDDLKVLEDIIQIKRRQSKYQDNLKLMQYLIRQGFSYGDIKKALSSSD